MVLSINETMRAVPLGKMSPGRKPEPPESFISLPVIRLDDLPTARIRLASGLVARVMDVSSANFYGWLAFRLDGMYPRRWPTDAQQLMDEYAGQRLDLHDRWYLLDAVFNLPKIKKQIRAHKLEIFVDEKQEVA